MEDPRARPSLGAALQQQLRRQLKAVVAEQQQQEEEEAPDAINVPFPRPAALFRLSSGSSSDGGDSDGASVSTLASASAPAAPLPFGRFVLPDVKLRKIVRRPIFENFDESAYDVKPPTQMLRFIDELRYHKPTDEERDVLNVSSATERLYLHQLNDILVVCGARKGFRYSSHDIVRLRSIAESLDAYYAAVDEAFRALPSDVIRFRFPEATRRLEDDAPNFERLRAHRKNGLCTVEERLEPLDAVRRQAFQFQWLARQYVVAFARLRNAVMEIRLRLLSSTKTPPTVPTLSDLNDPVEAEFEAKTHHPFPVYLFVLIQKYHREQRQRDDQWTLDSLIPPVDSIAHFALYLSELLLQTQPAPLTATELRSVQVLLQVVKVQFRVDEQKMAVQVAHVALSSGRVLVNPVWAGTSIHDRWTDHWSTSSSSSSSSSSDSSSSSPANGCSAGLLTRAALTALLFGFLTTVRELRLVPRDKDLLKRSHSAAGRRRSKLSRA